MKKPLEMTSVSVCKLIMREIREQKYAGHGGPRKAFAQCARVSPKVIRMIYEGAFPGAPPLHEQWHQLYIEGKVSSLTRICDTLGLDLEACLAACKLPRLAHVIRESRRPGYRGKMPTLRENDLDVLREEIRTKGPLPLHLIPMLLKRARRIAVATARRE